MAKSSGLGALFFVDEYDISGDTGSVERMAQISRVLDVTAINASGHERMHSHVDGELSFSTFFNDAAGQQHLALRNPQGEGDRVASYFQGSTIGNMAACMAAKQIDYAGNRSADGGLTFSVQCQASTGKGLDFCRMLTAGKRTDTGATNGSSLDGGAATALGLAAYLHVISFAGTDATVTIQESSDDGAGDAFAPVTGGAFTQVVGVTKERIVTSLTLAVERYLRVATSTSAGFSNMVFAVAATRYPVA